MLLAFENPKKPQVTTTVTIQKYSDKYYKIPKNTIMLKLLKVAGLQVVALLKKGLFLYFASVLCMQNDY